MSSRFRIVPTGAGASPQATALQVGNPALGTVSRKPQTTAVQAQPDVPFIRLSRRAKILGYNIANQAFGASINQPLKAVGGYLRGFRILVTASGGTSTAAVVAAADAPWNVISSMFLRDPLGQPVYQANGFDTFLVQKYSGQVASANGLSDPTKLPSFSAIQLTSGAGAGNFQFSIFLPLEFDSAAYCSLASMNASSQPTLQITLNSSAAVYTTPPGTLPTLTLNVTEEFWATPVAAPNLAPPQVGSSAQWSETTCAQTVNGQFARVTWGRVGTFIHTMIAVLRDNTGARVAAWPANDLTLYVDGVPVIIEKYVERQDDIFRAFGYTLETGVSVWTFRNTVSEDVSSADTHDVLLPTTPATLLEVAGTFGTVTNAPGQITAVTGELYPVGGIPYTHLTV